MKSIISFNNISSVNLTVLDQKFTGKDNVFSNLSNTFWAEYVPAKISKYLETGAVQQINHVVMTSTVMHKKTEVTNMLKGFTCHKLQASGKFGGKVDKTARISATKLVDYKGKKVARWYKAYRLYIERELEKAKEVGKAKTVTAPVLAKECAKLVKKFEKDSLNSILNAVTIAYEAQHKSAPVKVKSGKTAAPASTRGKRTAPASTRKTGTK